jgi:hypothetical protein
MVFAFLFTDHKKSIKIYRRVAYWKVTWSALNVTVICTYVNMEPESTNIDESAAKDDEHTGIWNLLYASWFMKIGEDRSCIWYNDKSRVECNATEVQ